MNLTEKEKEAIIAYADSNMNGSRTGKKIFLHRNSVYYRLRNVKEKTGLDPFNFYDLVKLVYRIKDGI